MFQARPARPVALVGVMLLLMVVSAACRPPTPPPVAARWTPLSLPPFPGSGPRAVECATATSCLVLGANGELAHWNGSTWTALALPAPAGEEWGVSDVSCPSATICLLGGARFGPDEDSQRAILLRWDGRSLTPLPFEGHGIFQLSCPEADWCMVRRSGAAPNESLGTWNGTAFTPTIIPTADMAYPVEGISCGSRTNCAASATQPRTGVGATFALAHWNGTAWSSLLARSTAGGGTTLVDNSCVGSEFCAAIGADHRSLVDIPLRTMGLAATWSRGAWSALAPISAPAPAGTVRNDPYRSVSCATAAWCVAIGSETSGGVIRETTRVWTGTGWAVAPPVPDGNRTAEAIDCPPGGRMCLAVGFHAVWQFTTD